jgi:hypothetical protein
MANRRNASLMRLTGCKPNEIEPGRAVPNNWEKHLIETWAARKARLASERARDGAEARA